MKSRVEEALIRRQKGYNCAQAVYCTYCEDFNISETDGYKLSEGFGSGMGGLKETCGAASAMFMLAGQASGDGILSSKDTRPHTYELIRTMASAFQVVNVHLACKDIMIDVDENGIRKHPCEECVASAASIVEKYLYKK